MRTFALTALYGCTDEASVACGVAGPVDALGRSMGWLAMLAYAIERLILVDTGAGGRAHMSTPGRSGIAVTRPSDAWPRLGPQLLMLNLIQRESFAVYFERSGHYPFIEEPQAFWSAVSEFLSVAT